MENKILIIDIETTGFLPKGKIVEIGIVELDVTTGERSIIFDKIVRSNDITVKDLKDAWIVQNGYMTVQDIVNGEDIELHKEAIQQIINSYPNGATAFNNQFDFSFMESVGFTFPKKLACPMLLSTPICKLPNKYGKDKWPKAEEAYKHFYPESEYTELHRGADDAAHEADIVFALIKLGVFTL